MHRAVKLARFQLGLITVLLSCAVISVAVGSVAGFQSNPDSIASRGVKQRSPKTIFRQRWKAFGASTKFDSNLDAFVRRKRFDYDVQTISNPVQTETEADISRCGLANAPSNVTSKSVSSSAKIVGGTETLPNEFPWQAFLILEQAQGSATYACGGSLIDNQWVLTAAHCLDNVEKAYVTLGVHDIRDENNEGHVEVYVSHSFFTHSDWNEETLHNDIALVRLPVNVAFSNYIRPICLDDTSDNSYNDVEVILTGWGLDSDDSESISHVLRKVSATVISNDKCGEYYDDVPNTVMCTDGTEARGPCNGDSGGPMNLKLSDGTWKQIGITSFGSKAGCEEGYPSGFTRISPFVRWIRLTMELNSASSGGNQQSLLPFLMAIVIFIAVRSFH